MAACCFPSSGLLRVVLALACGVAAAGGETRGGKQIHRPYQVDGHTLHLWHLDEAGPPFLDAVSKGQSMAGMLNGARAGFASLPGMGSGVWLHADLGGTPGTSSLHGAILAASPYLATGKRDNLPANFRYFGPNGAFTYEMIVKPEVLPEDAKCVALGLLSMEGDDADRIFNFRIEKQGFLSFSPLPHGGAAGGGVATIPAKGPHAIATNTWFHVAVTYDGRSNTSNNLKFYWTRLDSGVTAANFIGGGTLVGGFNGVTGDLAIGNEARSFTGNAEAEPFPGVIDEVRMSSVARHPSDFFFVPPEQRVTPENAARLKPPEEGNEPLELALHSVFVDSARVALPAKGDVLRLKSGLHRLDFDFGFNTGQQDGAVKLQCLLEGVDERWRATERGMMLVCEILDANDLVVSQSRFEALGRSAGWESCLEDSNLTNRSEPVFIPGGARKFRLSIASGSPETTGFLVVDDISLHAPGRQDHPLWSSEHHIYDVITSSPAGYFPGWKRGGADPAIARLVIRRQYPAIGLVDGDQANEGEWTTVRELPPAAKNGGVYVLSWNEAFNIIDGNTRRETYINIPPGEYTFRAMGVPTSGGKTGKGGRPGDSLDLAIMIPPPFWQRVWFLPVLSSACVGLLAGGVIYRYRQRAKRSMERLKFQNALEKDRTRIARDMHDDLGTRVTFINLSASMAQNELELSPENARRHLTKVSESARDLVVAMDDLVWAVDPSNDTLDNLASHLTRLADEMFRDSPVRCRMEIPSVLPPRPLGAEFRHHVSLAVKESLHNVLQHAGPCEVFLTLTFDGREIRVTVRDTGVGFDLASDDRGHGLDNLSGRLREIGGTCRVESAPGKGTVVVLSCPLAKRP